MKKSTSKITTQKSNLVDRIKSSLGKGMQKLNDVSMSPWIPGSAIRGTLEADQLMTIDKTNLVFRLQVGYRSDYEFVPPRKLMQVEINPLKVGYYALATTFDVTKLAIYSGIAFGAYEIAKHVF